MKSIINKLLNKPITEKPEQISYYEKYPLAQIHIDTMFYELTTKKQLIPIFIIADVATRYTQAYIQTRKNEKIQEHVDSFVSEVRKRWKSAIKDDSKILIISDGAKEFNVIKSIRKRHLLASIKQSSQKQLLEKFVIDFERWKQTIS